MHTVSQGRLCWDNWRAVTLRQKLQIQFAAWPVAVHWHGASDKWPNNVMHLPPENPYFLIFIITGINSPGFEARPAVLKVYDWHH